jgi:hypothetical protein
VAPGFDKSGPSLYWIDYLGNMEKMKIGGHGKPLLRRSNDSLFRNPFRNCCAGYGAYFGLSIMDRCCFRPCGQAVLLEILRFRPCGFVINGTL